MNSGELCEYFTDAIRFGEPRRLIYNVVLAVIVIAYFAVGYPSSKTVLSIDFALVVPAGCAAYLADVFVQVSGFREAWLRSRWILFVIGTAVAAIIPRFMAMGMCHQST